MILGLWTARVPLPDGSPNQAPRDREKDSICVYLRSSAVQFFLRRATPGGALRAVFEYHAGIEQFLADPVGRCEVLRLARGGSCGDLPFDPRRIDGGALRRGFAFQPLPGIPLQQAQQLTVGEQR